MSKLHKMDLDGFIDCAAAGMRPNYCNELRGFTAACYNDNAVDELLDALKRKIADKTDCDNWRITPSQWRRSIREAVEHAMYLYADDNGLVCRALEESK